MIELNIEITSDYDTGLFTFKSLSVPGKYFTSTCTKVNIIIMMLFFLFYTLMLIRKGVTFYSTVQRYLYCSWD